MAIGTVAGAESTATIRHGNLSAATPETTPRKLRDLEESMKRRSTGCWRTATRLRLMVRSTAQAQMVRTVILEMLATPVIQAGRQQSTKPERMQRRNRRTKPPQQLQLHRPISRNGMMK